jgi:hypothetical protein
MHETECKVYGAEFDGSSSLKPRTVNLLLSYLSRSSRVSHASRFSMMLR